MKPLQLGPSRPVSFSDSREILDRDQRDHRDVVCSRQPYGYSIRSRRPSSRPATPSGSVETSATPTRADAGRELHRDLPASDVAPRRPAGLHARRMVNGQLQLEARRSRRRARHAQLGSPASSARSGTAPARVHSPAPRLLVRAAAQPRAADTRVDGDRAGLVGLVVDHHADLASSPTFEEARQGAGAAAACVTVRRLSPEPKRSPASAATAISRNAVRLSGAGNVPSRCPSRRSDARGPVGGRDEPRAEASRRARAVAARRVALPLGLGEVARSARSCDAVVTPRPHGA